MLRKEQKIEQLKRKRSFKKILTLSTLLLGIFMILFIGIYFKIDKVSVSGNKFYTEKEIKEAMLNSFWDGNVLSLYLKNRYGGGANLPLVEEIEIDIKAHNAIHIQVYEKTIVGCLLYMGEYLHFDKDGVIIESTRESVEGIPLIEGIKFQKMNLHEKLEVENEDVFKSILKLYHLIKRYHLGIDKIEFSSKEEVTLYSNDIQIDLGRQESYDGHIAELSGWLPEAEKRKLKGTLDMKSFQEGQGSIIFKKKE